MDRVIGFYHVGGDVEPKIKEGPSGDIEGYLSNLNKLREGMEHFHQFNQDSMELQHLADLFDAGMDALVREFLQLLKKHSKPVHMAAMHDIAVCEDTEGALALRCPMHWCSALHVYCRAASYDTAAQ